MTFVWRHANRHLEHWARDHLLRLFSLCLPPPAPPASPAGRPQPSHVILLRHCRRVGDTVIVTSVIDECRRLFPHARLTLLVHARMAALFAGHPSVDQLWKLDPRWFLKPRATARLVRRMRQESFDVAIDCAQVDAPSLSNWILTRVANADHRVGFAHPHARKFVDIVVEPRRELHLISNQLRLLSPFAEPAAFRLPRLVLTETEITAARAEFQSVRRVMIFVAPHSHKAWPLETFMALADRLCRDGHSLLLSFGPGDLRCNAPEVQALVSRWGRQVRVLPVLGLRQLAAVMNQSELFISNDCGPMHLAVAAAAPTLAVFLRDNHPQVGYGDGRRHHVVTGANDHDRLDRACEVARSFLPTDAGLRGPGGPNALATAGERARHAA